jgi:membrane protease YdiL (CAAX protease family)
VAGCAIAGAALVAYVAWRMPEQLFEFPRTRRALWIAVMILYPLASAWPQEVLWRWLFFARYCDLFGSPAAAVLASAALFGAAHVVMRNRVAVALSFVGGLVFAETYRRTGSLWLVSLEHGLLGDIAFTVGFGRFLYAGATRAYARRQAP